MPVRELIQTVRALRATPWYAGTVIMVTALSMALAATILALADRALFRPLPYADVARTFAIDPEVTARPSAAVQSPAAPIDVAAWTAAMPEARVTAMYTGGLATIGTNEVVRSARVDAAFFDVFGVRAAGGGFLPADVAPAPAPRVPPALITHRLWQRRFGGDPAVVGRSFVSETGDGIRIVGILPAEFVFPSSSLPEVIVPDLVRDPTNRGRSLQVFIRLPADLPMPVAAARLTAASAAIARSGDYDAARLIPIRDLLTSGYAATTRIVFWAAAALVVLAVANIGGLSIARLQQRRRDLTLRRSLGASGADLIRLLAIEHGLLVLAGTIAGVWASHQLLAATLALMPRYLLLDGATVDLRVVALCAAAAVVCTGVLTSIAARSAIRSNARLTLSEGGATTGRRRSWVLAAQIALALVMTTGATLVAGSLIRVMREDAGFDIDRSAVVGISMPAGAPVAEMEAFVADLRQAPRVRAAGGIDKPLVERAFNGSMFDPPAGVTGASDVESMAMTQGFLDAAGLLPIEGRLPRENEHAAGAPVIVVSRKVARQYWPGATTLGQTLTADGRAYTVVGVVPDARYVARDRDPEGAIYLPMASAPRQALRRVLVRFDDDSAELLPGLTQWIATRCPRCWVNRAQTMSDAFAATIRPRRFYAWMGVAFAAAAVTIVATGILGLVAMISARRRREIGIRMALGATRAGVVRQFLREKAAAIAIGLAAGAAVSIWTTGFLETYLYKTTLADPAAWLTAIGLLVAVSFVATLIPTLRSTRVDPARVLRDS